MFKYLTKDLTPNSNLLTIPSNSNDSKFCQLRRSQILPGSQSTTKYSYIEVFWCLFFIGLGFSNTLDRNYLKWVWVCNWVHSYIHPFGHLALPHSHDTDSPVWRQLRVINASKCRNEWQEALAWDKKVKYQCKYYAFLVLDNTTLITLNCFCFRQIALSQIKPYRYVGVR